MKKTFRRGVHPSSDKLTKDHALTEFPTPDTVYISLSQHIGAPCDAAVNVGDRVCAGSLVGKAVGFVSCNVYSSVSGTVKGVKELPTASGGKAKHIEIENDGKYESVTLPVLDDPTPDEIVDRVREAGIVGMGGATFPLHVKLKPSKPVDTLVINGAECEPYITCDYRLMLERTAQVVEGVKLLKKALGVNRAVICAEDNKPDGIAALTAAADGVEILPLKTKYPQGAEKQLIYAATGRKVPAGGLPMDIGAVVCNLHTALSVYYAVKEGRPLYERAMTVTGRGVEKRGNYIVRNGVPYSFIYETTRGCVPEEDTVKVISGGPMMGFAQTDLSACTAKGSSSLIFATEKEVIVDKATQCINCARCASHCPMALMPMYIDSCINSGDARGAARYGAMNCIECGSCAFVCPAKRPLVQSCRLAKKTIKEKGIKI